MSASATNIEIKHTNICMQQVMTGIDDVDVFISYRLFFVFVRVYVSFN